MKIERLIQNGQINTGYIYDNQILRLVRWEILSVRMECDMRRHFEAKHPDMTKLDVSERQIKASNLRSTSVGSRAPSRK
jgi:hypothetical protein